MKIFLDANILFSAANTGSGMHALVSFLIENDAAITSDFAESEARKNIGLKRNNWRRTFEELIDQIERVPSIDAAVPVEIVEKDRPILATALAFQCEYLLTGDQRHFGHLFGSIVVRTRVVAVDGLRPAIEALKSTQRSLPSTPDSPSDPASS